MLLLYSTSTRETNTSERPAYHINSHQPMVDAERRDLFRSRSNLAANQCESGPTTGRHAVEHRHQPVVMRPNASTPHRTNHTHLAPHRPIRAGHTAAWRPTVGGHQVERPAPPATVTIHHHQPPDQQRSAPLGAVVAEGRHRLGAPTITSHQLLMMRHHGTP